jgi:hypothetical protein
MFALLILGWISSLGRLACKGDEDMSPWLSEELASESPVYLERRQ